VSTSNSGADASTSETGEGPQCGNDVLEGDEECDDGDRDSADGCSRACLDENDFCQPGQYVGGFSEPSVGRMVVEGDRLYYLSGSGASPADLTIVDVSSPGGPMQLGTWTINPEDYPNWEPIGLGIYGDAAWIGGINPEYLALDVSDPSAPVPVVFGGPNDSDGHLVIRDHFLYLSQSVGETVRILDITDPSSPQPSGSLGTLDNIPTNIGLAGPSGSIAATSQFGDVIDLWNIDMAGHPLVGQFSAPDSWGSTLRIVGNERSVFVGTDKTGSTTGGIVVIDIENPNLPVEASRIGTGATGEFAYGDLAVRGDYLYVPHRDGLQVWDVSDLEQPVLAGGFLQVSSYGYAVTLDDRYAYLANDDGIRIIAGLPGLCAARCGNLHVEWPEACDDGNLEGGDGCDAACQDE
jgi:cysteine-rich repeat protein